MKREPTAEEHDRIIKAVFAGDRVEATNIYISIKGCGLTEAQAFIKLLTADLKQNRADEFVQRSSKKHFFGLFKTYQK